MRLDINPDQLSIIIIYNVDPSWSESETRENTDTVSVLERAISQFEHKVESIPIEKDELESKLQNVDSSTQLVFNWCEEVPGIPRSEFLVAQSLESMGFTFTGAGSSSLELAQDKRQVKRLLEQSGIPTPRWRIFDRPERNKWDLFPAIVKSANEHCSEGLTPESVVTNENELLLRIAHVLEERGQPALVEDFIDGREFHVSLWGNGQIELLPVAEMDFSGFCQVQDRLCTYDAKFKPGSLHYEGIQTLLPAPLTNEELLEMERVCEAAYRIVGCRDYGRIDVRSRGGVFYVLDVNPNADISADASMACAAELAGYSYGEFGDRIARLASGRHPSFRN